MAETPKTFTVSAAARVRAFTRHHNKPYNLWTQTLNLLRKDSAHPDSEVRLLFGAGIAFGFTSMAFDL